ncbi:hypothetical protein SADUNF_Sadunf18G0045900 [Salix dunnii]|uniref:Uncharacterized protein n=1 Tax=Salix dunnii TaxID=1413687 RepID=A0A835J3C0_9ROSI|nr:hypothetical protein SADUNF_Sadunf18G0045900 [Salix dunnii]
MMGYEVEEIIYGLESGIMFRLFIVAGVILLVSSTWLLRHLPLCHFIRANADQNFSSSRSGSLRHKDSNPFVVIHAATLHHLISSMSKEKAISDTMLASFFANDLTIFGQHTCAIFKC